jgi:hypothetical protein|tara:strand:- start:67 stop:660 length:594 start_codon:yes stop_codon:yes gene_type:complete
MIIWSQNENLPDDVLGKLKKVVSRKLNENPLELYTTYGPRPHDDDETEVLGLLVPYYRSKMEQIMRVMGMQDRCAYQFNLWLQGYTKRTPGHSNHAHFSGDEILSWCHVIQSVDQNPFYFESDKGTKIYPEHQSSGDINVWPAWVMHGADPINVEGNRIIIAGNIMLQAVTDHQITAHCTKKESNEKEWVAKSTWVS